MPSAPWVTNNKAFSSPWSILVCWNLNVKYFEMECPVGFDFQEVYEYEWHGHCLFEDELFSMLWMWIHMRWSCFGFFFSFFLLLLLLLFIYIHTHIYLYMYTRIYLCVYSNSQGRGIDRQWRKKKMRTVEKAKGRTFLKMIREKVRKGT